MIYKIYPHEILRFFDGHNVSLSMKQANEIIKLIDLDRYKDMERKHAFILLKFFESIEEYSTCGEILKQLEKTETAHEQL